MSIENKQFDFWIPLATLVLMVYGYFALKSAVFRSPGYEMYPFRQLIWDILAFIFMFSIVFMKKRLIRDLAIVVYIISIALLIVVLFKAPVLGGAKRWISFKVVNFQPSELAKFSLVIILPQLLENPTLFNFILSMVLSAVPVFLIILEPDLGTAALIGFIWFSIAIASNVKWRYILTVLLIVVVIIPIFFFYGLKDYQRMRIEAFLNPEAFSKSAAYNILQSRSAIGSGKLFGRGYMKGPANLFNFVPVDYSDFIIAVIGEELGFVGIAILVFSYFFLMLRIYHIYEKAAEKYWKLVVIGTASVFFFHIVENLLMCIGAAPVTGIPLPFVSYGGSSALIFGGLLGLVMKTYSISKSGKRVEVR